MKGVSACQAGLAPCCCSSVLHLSACVLAASRCVSTWPGFVPACGSALRQVQSLHGRLKVVWPQLFALVLLQKVQQLQQQTPTPQLVDLPAGTPPALHE